MDDIVRYLHQLAAERNHPAALLVLGLSAAVEYIFPPYPGDTATLLGAFLVTAHGWSFWAVLGVTIAGSGFGALADFYLGRWLWQCSARWRQLHGMEQGGKLQGLITTLRRRGEAYLLVNRFLPGIRALFFVAAGIAGLRPGRVLLYALLSALAWNLLLIAAGASVGASWPSLLRLARSYALGAWLVVGIGLGALLVWLLWRRRSRRQGPPE